MRARSCIASHTRALELCPDATSAWHNRGEALMLRGSLAEAQSDLEQALRLQDTEQTARMLQHVRLELEGVLDEWERRQKDGVCEVCGNQKCKPENHVALGFEPKFRGSVRFGKGFSEF